MGPVIKDVELRDKKQAYLVRLVEPILLIEQRTRWTFEIETVYLFYQENDPVSWRPCGWRTREVPIQSTASL